MSTSTAGAFEPTAERLLQIIVEHAGPDGVWEFSYGVLADGATADPRRLEAGLAELERRGLIAIERCAVRLLDR